MYSASGDVYAKLWRDGGTSAQVGADLCQPDDAAVQYAVTRRICKQKTARGLNHNSTVNGVRSGRSPLDFGIAIYNIAKNMEKQGEHMHDLRMIYVNFSNFNMSHHL
jgi:hypothetical protein